VHYTKCSVRRQVKFSIILELSNKLSSSDWWAGAPIRYSEEPKIRDMSSLALQNTRSTPLSEEIPPAWTYTVGICPGNILFHFRPTSIFHRWNRAEVGALSEQDSACLMSRFFL